ncbi:CTP synthase [Candidatus Azambacteria bacterium]|nr:CTP synthase [Candidatus Azambacteria bacterium]
MKYIFVTGGVCSGLGKGISAASIGMLLKAAGYKVALQKLDPYFNIDPGTMNPHQHGEVFVTRDGAETDLDIGHYERFVDEEFSSASSASSGQIYQQVLNNEREGLFLGKTIQVIPHVTNTIKKFIRKYAEVSDADIFICEIGGTIGDIEAEPYGEALRQLHREEGNNNVFFVHLVFLPYIKCSNELKTKPAQGSMRELRRIGINPNIILARYDVDDEYIHKEHLEKIALFSDVPKEAVIPAPTVESIYEVPLNLEKYNITKLIANHFDIENREPNLLEWNELIKKIKSNLPELSIALVGKYMGLQDAYLSVIEAVKSAGYFNKQKIKITWIDSEKLESENEESKKEWKKLKTAAGLIVMGGFGGRGIEGKIVVAKYARENKIPYLGLCLGMQIAAIEFARNVLGIKDANSLEFNEGTKNPVIYLMKEQREIYKKGGTMRLGNYECRLQKDSKSFQAYSEEVILERHRHRYEFNNDYKKQFEEKGLVITGTNPESGLCEILENKNHPWFVGVQFHPEFKSRPLRPHPLFREFIKASL